MNIKIDLMEMGWMLRHYPFRTPLMIVWAFVVGAPLKFLVWCLRAVKKFVTWAARTMDNVHRYIAGKNPLAQWITKPLEALTQFEIDEYRKKIAREFKSRDKSEF